MAKKRKVRKVICVVSILLVLAVGITFAVMKMLFPGMAFAKSVSFSNVTASVDKFTYQPEKIEKGTVYHYVKSNMDNSKPANVAVFIGADDHLEVFKIYPGANATFFVTADFSWDIFSPNALNGYEIYKNMEKKLVMHSSWSKENDTFTYSDSKGDYSVPIGHYPLHNFNFDLTSLNYTFRHLTDPESTFNIGVHYPSFNPITFIKFVYTGEAVVRYISDETYNQKLCRKYEISGEGMRNKKGYIWVNKEGGYFENIEIPLSDNPSWNSFKLTLAGMEKMSGEEWSEYVTGQSKEYFADKK